MSPVQSGTTKAQKQRRILPSARLQPSKETPACRQRSRLSPLPDSQPAARGGGESEWIDDDVGGCSRRGVRGRRRRGLRRRAPRVRLRPDGADRRRRRRRRRQMRRVPPPTAGTLVVERPGRQVRAEVRRAAVHRDALHGAPLKSPEARPVIRAAPSRPRSSGDSFLPPSSRDSREEASC
ncbi:hypothetical protein ACQJBY_007480 [Aegilops geniculata]